MMDARGTKSVSISYIKRLDFSDSHCDCSLHINNDIMLTAYILYGARKCGKECVAYAREFTSLNQ